MLGRYPLLDMLLHFGLGIAAATTLVVTIWAVTLLAQSRLRVAAQNFMRVGIFVPVALAQLSLAAFIGATKDLSNKNSILGYAVGMIAALGVAWLAYRQVTSNHVSSK